MNNRSLAVILAVVTVIFVVLNFTIEAGTLFLILAVLSGIASGYYFGRG